MGKIATAFSCKGDKLLFRVEIHEYPPGIGILRMQGERIATPVCALARNDRRTKITMLNWTQKSTKTMSLRTSPQTGVAIRALFCICSTADFSFTKQFPNFPIL